MVQFFPGRLALQQRVLPAYRVPFFDSLAAACQGGLSVFAGDPRSGEAIQPAAEMQVASNFPARNRHLFSVEHSLYLCWQGGLQDWLETWDPDALVVEANPRYPSTRRAIRWMRARGRPVVGWGLGAPPVQGAFTGLRRILRRRFLSSFDALIAYSQRGAAEYRSLGFSAGKVFVATNAALPRPSAPMPDRPPQLVGRPRVIFVGRLQARKRVDLLLEACARLPEAQQPVLQIIGDGPERPSLEALALRVYPRAEFTGARHGEGLAHLLAAADLFVLPGTGGLAIQEAMAHGLPAIVAEGDGTQEDLVRPGNGWLVPPGDLQALVAALQEALSDVARLRQMGAESYRIACEEANLEQMVQAFLEALRNWRSG